MEDLVCRMHSEYSPIDIQITLGSILATESWDMII